MQKTSPLDSILTEIEQALDAKLYYLAIAVCLTLPEICISLISEDGRSTQRRYEQWFDGHMAQQYSFLTGKDMYSIRCGMVHNGRFGDLKHSVARVLFALPGNATFVNCLVNDAYIYSVEEFCRDFVAVVRKW